MFARLQPEWVASAEGLARVAAACAAAGRFALDTEADSLHTYFHKVCLIQVSAGERHFLLDPLAIPGGDLEPLWRMVADPGLPVVMHGADYDLRVLDRDFGARVGGLEDTQVMAQLLGEPRTGLAALLELALGERLEKRHQRADWGQRPLPEELLGYAAADTAFLLRLADLLRQRLVALGRWSWAVQEAGRLEQVRFRPPEPDPLAFERIKGARELTGEARDRIAALHDWRDRIARRRDLPPFKVIGNSALLNLAAAPPSDLEELTQTPGVGRSLARRHGEELLAVLRRPSPAPPRQRPARRERTAPEVRARLDKLVRERDLVAAELALAPGLVCPRELVEAVAAVAPGAGWPTGSGLDGWRLDLLGDRFRRAIEDP